MFCPPLNARGRGAGGEGEIPLPIQAAIASGDQTALQQALEALPEAERHRVETLLQEATRQAVERARQRRPGDILAGLPQPVRAALEQQDEAALQQALTALPAAERQRVLVDLADLQTLQLLAAQEAQQRDPRERFAALLRDAARVAVGDDGPREAVAQALRQLEQSGWMLRAPVERIWQGERNAAVLTQGLDAQDTALIERILELVRAYERGERRTPAQILAELPEAVRAAIETQDEAAFNAAVAALDDAERTRTETLLAALRDQAAEARLPSPARGFKGGQKMCSECGGFGGCGDLGR
jgi:hypothetical protein